MSYVETYCKSCKELVMDNEIHKICPICKSPDIGIDFDESPSGDDYDSYLEDQED